METTQSYQYETEQSQKNVQCSILAKCVKKERKGKLLNLYFCTKRAALVYYSYALVILVTPGVNL